MASAPVPGRTRSRLVLLLVFAIFLAPLAVAMVLYYSQWQPTRTRNYGQLLKPVRDLRPVRFTRADGGAFVFNHEDHVWRLLVAAPRDCGAACDRLEDTLDRIWVGLGNHADRVQVLWVGAPPTHGFRNLVVVAADAGLGAHLPDASRPDAIPVYLVDPTGYLFMRYGPGFDPEKLRRDVLLLIKQPGM